MKTAEEILKSKLDGKITFVNNPDYTFNKVIEAMEEYRLQSHPSPMSAEQVVKETGHDLINGALPYIEEHLPKKYIDTLAKYLDSYLDKVFSTTPSVKAEGWVSVEDGLPEEGQYLLLYGLGGRQFTALFKNGKFLCYNPFIEDLEDAEEVTHWQPLPAPPKQQL